MRKFKCFRKNIVLSVLLGSMLLTTACAEDKNLTEPDLSSLSDRDPIDVTPLGDNHAPGLADNNDSLHWTMWFGHLLNTGPNVQITYEDALSMICRVYNLTNGVHQMPYIIGQDVGRFGTAPELIPDDTYPMGDGTAGSGYARFIQFMNDAYAYNADVGQILEPMLAGSLRDKYIDASASVPEDQKEKYKISADGYSHDANNNKTVGWGNGDARWYNLTLANRQRTGAEEAMWDRMVNDWDYRMHVYFDALAPQFYASENRTEHDGSVLTDKKDELAACVAEADLAWEKYAISSGQEVPMDEYLGHSCYFTWPQELRITDEHYLNFWGNNAMFSTRVYYGDEEEKIKNLVWGSEIGDISDGFGTTNANVPNGLVPRFFLYTAPYLYILEQSPVSYINNNEVYQVNFTADLVSKYERATKLYTLTQGDVTLAYADSRFVPQVGAGCRIYCYSQSGSARTWKLPSSWDGVTDADLYVLSQTESPKLSNTISVKDGSVTVAMSAGVPYLLVPAGCPPTPETLMFNDLEDGAAVTEYGDISWKSAQGDIRVYPASAKGGFGSPSVYIDSSLKEARMTLTAPKGTILHSVKVGSVAGGGRIFLYSSNPENTPVVMTLPENTHIRKLNTGWRFPETGKVTIAVENDAGASNVLMDCLVITRPDGSPGRYAAVTLPNVTCKWYTGMTYTVSWDALNVDGTASVQLTADGKTWHEIASADVTGGSVSATLPDNLFGPACVIRLVCGDYTAESTPFTVVDSSSIDPYLNVISPSAAECWIGGTTTAVSWESVAVSGNVTLEVSDDGGKNWTLLTESASNDKHAIVNVPDELSGKECVVRVNSSGVSATSEPFTAYGANEVATIFHHEVPKELNTDGNVGVAYNYEMGIRFTPLKDGTIVAARLYMQQGESGTYNIRLWTPDGKLLAGPFSHNLSSDTDGWVTILLDEPIRIAEGNEYILAINTNEDRQYARSQNVMLKTVTSDFFTLNKNAGLIGFNGAVPSYVYDSSNYFRDIVFIPDSKS